MVEATGLAPRVDKAVVERVVGESGTTTRRQAVNLSPNSLRDAEFNEWLVDHLRRHPEAAARLILELPEYGAVAEPAALGELVGRLAPLGVQWSLDHFGVAFSGLGYLHRLKVDYLKVDGSFIRGLDEHEENQLFLQALAKIAHGLDMTVVAESVESEAVWRLLPDLGLDAGRGYWLAPPARGSQGGE